jgi:hypothetical protein
VLANDETPRGHRDQVFFKLLIVSLWNNWGRIYADLCKLGLPKSSRGLAYLFTLCSQRTLVRCPKGAVGRRKSLDLPGQGHNGLSKPLD